MQGMTDLGQFGDERLKKRGRISGGAHGQAHGLPAALGGDRATTEGYRRFLHNEAVTREIMLSTVADHTAVAARGRHVLAIQDTTELNFSGHKGSKRGSAWSGNGRDIGFFCIR